MPDCHAKYEGPSMFTNTILCQSSSEQSPTGCCENGSSCDELCIASVAAFNCSSSSHAQALTDVRSSPTTMCPSTETKRFSSRREESQDYCTVADGVGNNCCGESLQRHVECEKFDTDQARGAMEEYAKKTSCCGGCPLDMERQPTMSTPTGECSPTETKESRKLESHDDTRASLEAAITSLPEASEPTKFDTDLPPAVAHNETHALNLDVLKEGPCSFHLQQAFDKYTAFLESGLCICRDVIAKTPTCCDARVRTRMAEQQGLFKKDTAYSTACNVQTTRGHCEKKINPLLDKQAARQCRRRTEKPKSAEPISDGNGCCAGKTRPCDEEQPVRRLLNSTSGSEKAPINVDIEQTSAREHVSFNIVGMTCTGCVKKITGSLGRVDGVENVQVNFVAGLGDFDVDASKIDASEALHRLERETGFSCSRITCGEQILDILMDNDGVVRLKERFESDISISKKSKTVFQVAFDPKNAGARDILGVSQGALAFPTRNRETQESRRLFLRKCIAFAISALFTVPVATLAWAETSIRPRTKSITSLVLATVVQAIAISEFYQPALKALIFSKTIEMDMLVVISITAAYGYSVVAFSLMLAEVHLVQGPFFETSTLLITLILLGRVVSSYGKVKAAQAGSLRSLQAETAYLEASDGSNKQIDARLLHFNDCIMIPPHSKIVSDGIVIKGISTVDESMITGESRPIPKAAGDTVIAGTLNDFGALRVRLTRLPGQNSITDIAHLVENALGSQPRVQDLADVVAGWFVPIVIGISIVTFVIWIVIALRLFDTGGAIATAITYGVAVLAVSCPCAIGLAVPLVLAIARGVAARAGVVIKRADAIERSFKTTDVVFDKTGTLTSADLQVVQVAYHCDEDSHTRAMQIALALTQENEHPVSKAVAAYLKLQQVSASDSLGVESVPGSGVQGLLSGARVRAGNPRWLGVHSDSEIKALEDGGRTVLSVTLETIPLISFALTATLRPEANNVITHLKAQGLICHLVSGDNANSVNAIADALGFPPTNVASMQTPSEKQEYVRRLIDEGRTVLFVGDGTNDAVAIAQAHIGVQIGSTSDVTRSTAGVVLLGDLDGLLSLLRISRHAYRRIIFNFAWSGVYNLFAILLAAGAFVKVRIPPEFAGLGEIVSVLPVIVVAMTLMRVKL